METREHCYQMISFQLNQPDCLSMVSLFNLVRCLQVKPGALPYNGVTKCYSTQVGFEVQKYNFLNCWIISFNVMKKCLIESDICFEYVFNLVICIDSVKKNWIDKSKFGTKTQLLKHSLYSATTSMVWTGTTPSIITTFNIIILSIRSFLVTLSKMTLRIQYRFMLSLAFFIGMLRHNSQCNNAECTHSTVFWIMVWPTLNPAEANSLVILGSTAGL
jgi:hypothetical protein